eukprot:66047_1
MFSRQKEGDSPTIKTSNIAILTVNLSNVEKPTYWKLGSHRKEKEEEIEMILKYRSGQFKLNELHSFFKKKHPFVHFIKINDKQKYLNKGYREINKKSSKNECCEVV